MKWNETENTAECEQKCEWLVSHDSILFDQKASASSERTYHTEFKTRNDIPNVIDNNHIPSEEIPGIVGYDEYIVCGIKIDKLDENRSDCRIYEDDEHD